MSDSDSDIEVLESKLSRQQEDSRRYRDRDRRQDLPRVKSYSEMCARQREDLLSPRQQLQVKVLTISKVFY